jgi:ribosomal-protein-alanine N-acetyltransferase
MRIVEMTEIYATDIVTWRYDAPYNCYDMTTVDPAALVDTSDGYFALVDQTGLIGFRSFGADGQVPGGNYDDSALDTGGGLRPVLTGKGLGREAISVGLDFGRRTFAPAAFRVTVATFNIRARRVVTSLGFQSIGRFVSSHDGKTFEMLIRRESGESGDELRDR